MSGWGEWDRRVMGGAGGVGWVGQEGDGRGRRDGRVSGWGGRRDRRVSG